MSQELKPARVKQCYLLILSSGPAIPFDPDEMPKVRMAIKNGDIAGLRRGLFNPSFFVSVVQDEKRHTEFLETTKYSDDASKQRRALGMRPLSDIFETTQPQLPSANDG